MSGEAILLMENEKIKIKYTDYGLANFFGDYIEINKAFKHNKKLRDYVVKHELGHSKKFDLLHEFKIDFRIMPSLIGFIIKHPSTWIDFIPIQIRKKKIIYDLNLIILYSFIILLTILLIKIF